MYSDRELLARTLQAEAGNQGPGGLLAAGSVIMNRARGSGYGDGLRGAILAPGQFSAWNSVTGYAGGEQGQDMAAMRPSEDAYQVADQLISGQYEDPTGGATHYYNPSISQPSWGMGNGGEWTRIGDHVFGNADGARGSVPASGQNTGQAIDGRLSTSNTQAGAAPMPEQEDTSIWRNTPFLSDPDRRARLAMGLEGMTLNPNQALIENFQGGIDDRREQGKLNETAAWLQSQPGGAQFAQALMSGIPANQVFGAYMDSIAPQAGPTPIEINGQLVDPTTGNVIGDYRTPETVDAPSPNSPIAKLQDDLNRGLITQEQYDQAASGIGASDTPLVTVEIPGADKFAEAFAAGDAAALAVISDSGMAATRNIARIDQLGQLLADSPSGLTGLATLKAGEWGINTEGLSELQAAQAMISSLVPEQRQPGSGPMSDADLDLFKQSLPRIINQPGGNEMIINTMRAIAQYDAEGARIVQRLRAGEINRAQAFSDLQTRPDPMSGFRGSAPMGAPAAPSGGGAGIDALLEQYGGD